MASSGWSVPILRRHNRGARRRSSHLAVNGRFRQRPVTGVERFAGEVLVRLDLPIEVLEPPRWLARGPLGHLWEQVVLPIRLALAGRPHLWSPCNFGPVLVRNQTVTIHDVAPLDHPEWFRPGYRWLARTIGKLLYRRCLTITTDSEFSKQRMTAHWGSRRGSLVIIGGGVSVVPEGANTAAGDPTDTSDEICVVGTLDPRKNLEGLIRGVEAARRRGHDLRLTVIGGIAAGVFAETVGRGAVPDWVDFTGRLDDEAMAERLQGSLCLAYPSRYEGFGLPPLEAMALGVPVVASDIPPVHEVCGEAVRYADPDDPSSWAGAFADVAAMTRSERSSVIEAGRAASSRWTWERAADEFRALFAGTIGHVADAAGSAPPPLP